MNPLSIISLVIFGLFTIDSVAQNPDQPKIIHLSTQASHSDHADSIFSDFVIKGGLVVLSLSSVEMFEHFDRDVETLKNQYKGNKLVVAVDRDGTSEKGEFVLDFYRLSNSKKSSDVVKDAFDEALKNINTKYKDLHFKAALYDLTEGKKE